MRLYLFSVLLCFLNQTNGGWLRDLISSKGLHFGDGFVLQLTNSRYPNSTFFERLSILMGYESYGFSVTKIPKRKAIEVGLYTAQPEARLSKNSIFSVIIGYKMITMLAIGLTVVGALVLKALFAAKIAVLPSIILLISKVFYHKEDKEPSIELDHPPLDMHADYSEIIPSEIQYYPSEAGSYYQYSNLPPVIDYTVAESPGSNSSLPILTSNQQVVRRRSGFKSKRIPLVTIHQYSVKT